MEFKLHIPACFTGRETPIDAEHASRALAMRLQAADFKIGIWLDTPPKLVEMRGPIGGFQRLAVLGRAVLQTLEDSKPRFHYSVVQGRLARTTGTTIMVTGRTRDDRDTIVATWDYGESHLAALGRLGSVRTLLESVPCDVAVDLLARLQNRDFPPPQVLLSIVTMLDDPDMALGSAPGASPIAMAVGRKRIHVVFDHRLYDPADEAIFVDTFLGHLEEELTVGNSAKQDAE